MSILWYARYFCPSTLPAVLPRGTERWTIVESLACLATVLRAVHTKARHALTMECVIVNALTSFRLTSAGFTGSYFSTQWPLGPQLVSLLSARARARVCVCVCVYIYVCVCVSRHRGKHTAVHYYNNDNDDDNSKNNNNDKILFVRQFSISADKKKT